MLKSTQGAARITLQPQPQGGPTMSAVPKRLLTVQEYLAQERRAEFRSEFYRGEVFAMAGTSYRHCQIKDNVAQEAGSQLKGGPCRVVTSDLRVRVTATGLYTYPDVVFLCGQPEFEDQNFDVLLNPRAIVEVLSDSTESYDRGDKFTHYQKLPSLQEYVLIAQNKVLCERYVRQPNDSWPLTPFDQMDQALEFVSVPVRIPLSEVYRDVKFPESAGH
jgi:Uma2 family endonuclease